MSLQKSQIFALYPAVSSFFSATLNIFEPVQSLPSITGIPSLGTLGHPGPPRPNGGGRPRAVRPSPRGVRRHRLRARAAPGRRRRLARLVGVGFGGDGVWCLIFSVSGRVLHGCCRSKGFLDLIQRWREFRFTSCITYSAFLSAGCCTSQMHSITCTPGPEGPDGPTLWVRRWESAW